MGDAQDGDGEGGLGPERGENRKGTGKVGDEEVVVEKGDGVGGVEEGGGAAEAEGGGVGDEC